MLQNKCRPQSVRSYFADVVLGGVTGATGAGVTGAGSGAGAAGAAASAFDGMVSFWPTLMCSDRGQIFAASIAFTVVPCECAILVSVSPDLTV